MQYKICTIATVHTMAGMCGLYWYAQLANYVCGIWAQTLDTCCDIVCHGSNISKGETSIK